MSSDPAMLSKTLVETINIQLTAFEKISPVKWIEKPHPDKWSKKEILGHLIDSALNNIHRFVRIQYDDKTNIYYDQDFWVKANDYENQEIKSVISLWKLLNLQIAQTWKNTPEELLYQTIPVKDEFPTLRFLMEDYINHMKHHLGQISK